MLLPRPSLLAHFVISASLASGLALGVAAGLAVLATHRLMQGRTA